MIRKLTNVLSRMNAEDPFRKRMTAALLKKLYDMGLVARPRSLVDADKVTVSAFCRRRLAVVLMRLKFVESLQQGQRYVAQGHIRIGPQLVLDSAVHVTRKMEDFVTWTDKSAIRHKILVYRNEEDDYDWNE